MDLHLAAAEPTAAERAAVDTVLDCVAPPTASADLLQAAAAGRIQVGGTRARRRARHLLLPALHGVQDQIGWISAAALGYICRRLDVAPAEAYGVASFYALLATEERPPRVAHVCDDIVCRGAGAALICQQLEAQLGPAHHPTATATPEAPPSAAARQPATWITSPCLGLCERAPAVLLQCAGEPDATSAPATAEAVHRALLPDAGSSVAQGAPGPSRAPAVARNPTRSSAPQTDRPDTAADLTLLRRVGRADPDSMSDYRRHDGYAALRRALELGPEGVLRELNDAKLLGRGGAAFPTAAKWQAVAHAAARPHYVVCNADESEPGTFKDRVIMEQDPFAVLEALTIAAFATGAEQGYLYIRGEYPLATRRLQQALAEARARGMLGRDILGAGVHFDIELRRGAGAYICGEETALFNSLEGFRGEPRSKPPYPTEIGLFGQPTVVNNVETLVNLLPILLGGGQAYAAVGTTQSTGTKLFCLSGAVAVPGVYEVEFGVTLRELLDLAGGTTGGMPRAVLLGGAAGSFVGPEHLDVVLTFEGTREIGATLGSGVVMPFPPTTNFPDIVQRIARFFRDESCGQCVPCRVGTARQEEALQRLSRDGSGPDRALLADLAQVMGDASICALGHTAATALQSALRLRLLERGV